MNDKKVIHPAVLEFCSGLQAENSDDLLKNRTLLPRLDVSNNGILNTLRNFSIDDNIKDEEISDTQCPVDSSSSVKFVSEVYFGFDSSSEYSSADETADREEVLREFRLSETIIENKEINESECENRTLLNLEAGLQCFGRNPGFGASKQRKSELSPKYDCNAKSERRTRTCYIFKKKFDCNWNGNECSDERIQDCQPEKSSTGKKDVRKYICERCGNNFRQKRYFTRHIQSCGIDTLAANVTKFLCSSCGKMCNTKWQLKQHLMFHNDIRPFSCDLCNRKFRYTSRLKEHRRTHLGVRPHLCDQCDRTFNTISELNKHSRRHSTPGYRMYDRETDPNKLEACPVCHRLVVNVNTHMYSHTNSKDVRCNICSKPFKCRTSLYAHAKLHSKPLAFSCDLCGRKFNRKSNLICHRQLHSKLNYKPKLLIRSAHTKVKLLV